MVRVSVAVVYDEATNMFSAICGASGVGGLGVAGVVVELERSDMPCMFSLFNDCKTLIHTSHTQLYFHKRTMGFI